MAGNKKGSKYVKLRGGEVATPENEARARAFLEWYGEHADHIRRKLLYDHLYDDEVATDTMLTVYDCIALKGLRVENPKFYYLRAYHTNFKAAQMKRAPVVSIDAPLWEEGETLADTLRAPDFDYIAYEEAVDGLKSEMTQYVRDNYHPADCSIFEMYVALLPDTSYKKLARMLGFPENKVWPIISGIKKDLAARYSAQKDFILSTL